MTPSARAYQAVVAGAERGFELGEFVFGPNTDLVLIAQQTDTEYLEGLMEYLDMAFSMRKPAITDKTAAAARRSCSFQIGSQSPNSLTSWIRASGRKAGSGRERPRRCPHKYARAQLARGGGVS